MAQSMSALDRQRQIELNTGKTFINAIGWGGGGGVPSLEMRRIPYFFAAIIATRNGTEGSNFQI
jgi:hypothetical protein